MFGTGVDENRDSINLMYLSGEYNDRNYYTRQRPNIFGGYMTEQQKKIIGQLAVEFKKNEDCGDPIYAFIMGAEAFASFAPSSSDQMVDRMLELFEDRRAADEKVKELQEQLKRYIPEIRNRRESLEQIEQELKNALQTVQLSLTRYPKE